jgi:hypothetical protein
MLQPSKNIVEKSDADSGPKLMISFIVYFVEHENGAFAGGEPPYRRH